MFDIPERRNETDDEEFFPHSTHHHQGQRRYEIPSHESVDSDSTEEFDPRRRIYKNMNGKCIFITDINVQMYRQFMKNYDVYC